jgi:hypothetical protein
MPAPTSASGAAEPGPPRTELQELQFKAGQTTDEVRACEGGLPSLPPSRALGPRFWPSVLALGSGPRFWPSVLALGSGPRFWPAVLGSKAIKCPIYSLGVSAIIASNVPTIIVSIVSSEPPTIPLPDF